MSLVKLALNFLLDALLYVSLDEWLLVDEFVVLGHVGAHLR
jgi:hypothetical protein